MKKTALYCFNEFCFQTLGVYRVRDELYIYLDYSNDSDIACKELAIIMLCIQSLR